MKFLLPICLICLSTVLFAQKAKQSSVYITKDHKLFTYTILGETASAAAVDDGPAMSSAIAENLKAQFSKLSGVIEVIYDKATNTISVTALKTAQLPEEVHYKQTNVGIIRNE